MSTSPILVIDEGTTGTRALVIDRASQVRAWSYAEITQFHPEPDRVEQDPEEIWRLTLDQITAALAEARCPADQLACLGITNQRGTTVLWDRATGAAVTPAIVWQDTRTAGLVDRLAPEWGEKVRSRVGWNLAPVLSVMSLAWLFDADSGLARRAQAGELAFGTVDSWLIHRLTGGAVHAIGASNAPVTGAYDLLAGDWYTEWIDALALPRSLFPTVVDDSGPIGVTDARVLGAEVPITAAVADQSAALFGEHCLEAGEVKCSHGTGTFLDMNVGTTPVISASGLNSIIGWRRGGETHYGLEGYAPVTGAVVQWLRDKAHLIDAAEQTYADAMAVPDSGGVYFVPALTGLGAPSWDSYARGTIIGITPGTTREHIVRAALEGIVFSILDFLEVMVDDTGHPVTTLRADGGGAANDFLMQFEADMTGATVVRGANHESTALGAAYLAGLGAGLWHEPAACFPSDATEDVFHPALPDAERQARYAGWQRAVERAKGWARP